LAADGRTEKATPKKRRDERKKGNIFQSKDIINVVSVLIIFFTLRLCLPFIFDYLELTLYKYLGWIKSKDALSATFAMEILIDGILCILFTAGPIMAASIFAGILAGGVQTKFAFSSENLKPKFSRLNPLSGIKRLFSLRSVVELLKSLFKITIIGYMLYDGFKKIIASFPNLISVSTLQAVSFILQSVMDIVIRISVVFAVLAFFDFLYQWWEYEKSIRMTKQEIKEEYKHMEGDPQVKGRIKEKMRLASTRRMMQKVPTADVVIKNPTHFAVALKYDSKANRAPVVVAKGQDYTALKIIKIAEENHIPTRENKPLARAIYYGVEIDREIPPEFYAAMAEILAWVFTLKKERSRA